MRSQSLTRQQKIFNILLFIKRVARNRRSTFGVRLRCAASLDAMHAHAGARARARLFDESRPVVRVRSLVFDCRARARALFDVQATTAAAQCR